MFLCNAKKKESKKKHQQKEAKKFKRFRGTSEAINGFNKELLIDFQL